MTVKQGRHLVRPSDSEGQTYVPLRCDKSESVSSGIPLSLEPLLKD